MKKHTTVLKGHIVGNENLNLDKLILDLTLIRDGSPGWTNLRVKDTTTCYYCCEVAHTELKIIGERLETDDEGRPKIEPECGHGAP